MPKTIRRYAVIAALLSAFVLAISPGNPSPARAQDATSNNGARSTQSYTTITDVTVTSLSNGVQIRIAADGILQYQQNTYGSSRVIDIRFPDARNGFGKNFLNVNKYPVSYIALTTPQGATNGIGLEMTINNFLESGFQITQTPDGQGVLITIQSNRTIDSGGHASSDAGSPQTASATGTDTSTQVSFAGGKLSVRAVHADVASLIAAIAQASGLSVAVDDAVDRKISLNMRDVTAEAAVQSIATGNGLALSQIGGIYILSEGVPNDLTTYRVSGTESFRMQNTQAATASGLLPNFLYSYVKVNSEQNAVVVTAPTQMLAKIGKDLERVDIPSPQIAVEAIVVELTNDVSGSLGLLLNDTRSTSVTGVDTTAGTISYDSVGMLPQNFLLTLQALEQTNRARVRARPRMTVVNGGNANIFIGEQEFIVTTTNSFGQQQTRIQPVNVGVTLGVTPLTGGNGEITTTLTPMVSNITSQDPVTGLPVLSTRNASTTVRVRDGETIVIGGLTLNQKQVTNQKIPFFGDLPILGPLFRSQTTDDEQTELVVFVTPHIVSATVPAASTASDQPSTAAPPPPAAAPAATAPAP
jgi:type IV pilus assembly protein PilQ